MKYIVLAFFYLVYIQLASQEVIDTSLLISEVTVNFESAQWSLDSTAEIAIKQIALRANKLDSIIFHIEAHTDPIGDQDYNLELSEKRKHAVINSLLTYGITEGSIKSSSYGEERPLQKALDENSNRINRRATLKLLQAKQVIFIEGNVIDAETKKGIHAELSINTENFSSTTKTDTLGRFRILSPFGELVSIEVTAEGYFIESNRINISEKHLDLQLRIPLPKLELGRYYLFKNMLFYGDRSMPLPESQLSIKSMEKFMKLNPEVCVEIAGHINKPSAPKVPTNSANYELSVARALYIKKAMIERNIDADRICTKGYGNWKMKFPKAIKEQEMRQNRRVEIGVIDCQKVGIEEDFILDQDRYLLPIMFRKFDERLYNTELIMSSVPKASFIAHISTMREKGLNPSNFTYKEIFKAYPDFPSF